MSLPSSSGSNAFKGTFTTGEFLPPEGEIEAETTSPVGTPLEPPASPSTEGTVAAANETPDAAAPETSAVEDSQPLQSPPARRRGLPRDVIEPGLTAGPDEPLLLCPRCNRTLNDRSTPGGLKRSLANGTRLNCPGCQTPLRLDLILDDDGVVQWHVAQRPELPPPDLRPREHLEAATLLITWLRRPEELDFETILARFSERYPGLRPWEVMFGVYEVEHMDSNPALRQRRVDPSIRVPLAEYRAVRRRSQGLPVRPVNGVYPLEEVLMALAPPDRMSCGSCTGQMRAEPTADTVRLTCPGRRQIDAGCTLDSTRRLTRVQLAIKDGIETLLTSDRLEGLHVDFLDNLYTQLGDLAERGWLPPRCPLSEPTDEERAVALEWGDPPDAIEQDERLWQSWHSGSLPLSQLPQQEQDYVAEWLKQLRAIQQLEISDSEESVLIRDLERAQGEAILEQRCRRLPCPRVFFWNLRVLANRLEQCRIAPELLTDLVECVTISDVTDEAGQPLGWEAHVRISRSAIVKHLLPPGDDWPLPTGSLDILVRIDPTGRDEVQIETVRVLSDDGHPQREIADILGISQSTVSRIAQAPRPINVPLALAQLLEPSIELPFAPWRVTSDKLSRQRLKACIRAFGNDEDIYVAIRPWSLGRKLRAGDERDVEGDGYGRYDGQVVETHPAGWRTRAPQPQLSVGQDDALADEISGMIPLLYVRDESGSMAVADSGWLSAQALAFDGERPRARTDAALQTIHRAARELRAIDRGEIPIESPLLMALFIWQENGFERVLIEVLAEAQFDSSRISACTGYPVPVIDYVRHLFPARPPLLDPRHRERSGSENAAVLSAMETLLLTVARHEPERVMRLLAAWAELGFIPRTCRYEFPVPALSEGELLTDDLLLQSEFLTATEENRRFVTRSFSTIERIRKSKVRKADKASHSREDDELDQRVTDSLNVLVPALQKSAPDILRSVVESGCDLSPYARSGQLAEREGPTVDRNWQPVGDRPDRDAQGAAQATGTAPSVTAVNQEQGNPRHHASGFEPSETADVGPPVHGPSPRETG